MERLKPILVMIAAVLFVSSPFFVTNFAGFDPALYPVPQIDPPVQPAGYAFAIWGPIYLWLIIHAAFSWFRRADDRDWDRTRWPLFASLLVGSSWLWVATKSPFWATVLIFFMAATAIAALLRTPRADRWLAQAPLGVYAGWLSAASFVSLGMLGAGYGIAFDTVGWAYAAIALATALAGAVQWRLRRAPAYGLAVVWALVAIAAHNAGVATGVALFAGVAAAIILAITWRAAILGAR